MKRAPPGFHPTPNHATTATTDQIDEASLTSIFRLALENDQADDFFLQQERFLQDTMAAAPPPPPPPTTTMAATHQPSPSFFSPPLLSFHHHQQQQPPPPQQERFPDFKYMKGRDIAYIVRTQLKQVETGNEFADDFYFLQLQHKRRTAAMKETTLDDDDEDEDDTNFFSQLKQQRTNTTPNILPLYLPAVMGTTPTPTTPSTATPTWFQSKHTLGRTVKTNLRTPKELIVLDPTAAVGDFSNRSSSSTTWELRQIVQTVFVCFQDLLDLHQLVDVKLRVVNPQWTGDSQHVLENLQSEYERKRVEFETLLMDPMKLAGLLFMAKGRRLCEQILSANLPRCEFFMVRIFSKLHDFVVSRGSKDLRGVRALVQQVTHCNQLLVLIHCFQEMLVSYSSPSSLHVLLDNGGGNRVIKALVRRGQALADASSFVDEKLMWDSCVETFIQRAEQA